MEIALEAGADDIRTAGDIFEVYTAPERLRGRAEGAQEGGHRAVKTPRSASTPRTTSPSRAPKAQQMLKLIEALEDHDDVQNVWANFDISEKEMEAAAAG